MKIAFVSQPRDFIFASSAQNGSVAIVTWELARRLARDHDVTVYAPGAPGQDRQEDAAGVHIRRVPRLRRQFYRALDLFSGMLGTHPPYFTRDSYFAEYARAVAVQLKSDPPDCIHIQVASQFIPVFRRAAPHARVVLHCHDELLTRIDTRPVSARIALAHAVVTCSDYIKARWQLAFPSHASRIWTVRNGVDLDRFRPVDVTHDPPARTANRDILYVGRVSPEKGVHVLATAFERVKASFPEARLKIVGPSGLLPFSHLWLLADDAHVASLREFYGTTVIDQVRRQVLRASRSYVDSIVSRLSAHTAESVEFVGSIPYDQVPGCYQRAGVLAAPSVLAEPFGLPLAEALACGLPVVASRAGGMPEVINDGVDGLLVERGNVEELARALCRLLAEDELRSAMGVAGSMKAQREFSWDSSAKRLAEVYDALPRGQSSESPRIAGLSDAHAW